MDHNVKDWFLKHQNIIKKTELIKLTIVLHFTT